MPLLAWKCLVVKIPQYILDVGKMDALTPYSTFITFNELPHSMNASYHVGEYFAANRTSQASPNVYWLNNFESLYAAFGIHKLCVV